MGIFNRSIPTYTVDTANKLRITTPVEEPEQQSTYIDDAFDPIFNKAVRDRLMKEWGNPISATAAGYYELLDNSIVGSTKEWGALGSGMGILSSFGRTMDKGGDLVLGTLTEGIKGVTGQGVESPFHNIFVKDQDYSGGRILAAMGNSMAKLANAPQLTEEDFGGIWQIPSIGIELATDPGILGGAMVKAGGGVGNLSTAEVLTNLGRAGRSPLADVGQLLSNYDDAMSKIALDITAPGTRFAIDKFKTHINQAFKHSSPEDYADRILIAVKNRDAEGLKKIHREMNKDAVLKKQLELDEAQSKKIKSMGKPAIVPIENVEKLVKDVPKISDPDFTMYDDLNVPETAADTYKGKKGKKGKKEAVFKENYSNSTMQELLLHDIDEIDFGHFRPEIFKNSTYDVSETFEDYVDNPWRDVDNNDIGLNKFVEQLKVIQDDLNVEKSLFKQQQQISNELSRTLPETVTYPTYWLDKSDFIPDYTDTLDYLDDPYRDTLDSESFRFGNWIHTYETDKSLRLTPTPPPKYLKTSKHNVREFLKTKYKALTPEDKLNYLITHSDYFGRASFDTQSWFKIESARVLNDIAKDPKHANIRYIRDTTTVDSPYAVKVPKPSTSDYIDAVTTIEDLRDASTEFVKVYNLIKAKADVLLRDIVEAEVYADVGFVNPKKFKRLEESYKRTLSKLNDLKYLIHQSGTSEFFAANPELLTRYEEAFGQKYTPMSLYNAFLVKDAYEKPDTYRYVQPLLQRQKEAIALLNDDAVKKEFADLYTNLVDKSVAYPASHTATGMVPNPRPVSTSNRPTRKLYENVKHLPNDHLSLVRAGFDMSEEDFVAYLTEKQTLDDKRAKYLAGLEQGVQDLVTTRNKVFSDITNDVLENHPGVFDSSDTNIYGASASFKDAGFENLDDAAEQLIHRVPDWERPINEYFRKIRDGWYDGIPNINDNFDEFKEFMYDYFDDTYELNSRVIARNEFNNIFNVRAPSLEDAVISVSPSTIYNLRSEELVKNAVAYIESKLREVFKDFGYLNRVNDRSKLWKRLENDPVLQNIFTPAWKSDRYLDDLELLCDNIGVKLPTRNPRLKENFFKEIVSGKYPELRKALKIEDSYIKDFSKAIFGDGKKTWVYDTARKKGRWETQYTVQNQFLALDSFTENIINTIKDDIIDAYTYAGVDYMQELIEYHGVGNLLNPITLSEIFADKGLTPSELKHVYANIQRQLNGDFYSELYNFAKEVQEKVIRPIKLQYNFLSSQEVKEIAKHDEFYAKRANNLDYTYDVNKLLREHPAMFKSIDDVRQFYLKDHMYSDAQESATAFGIHVNNIGQFVEVKFKNMGRLQIEGSTLPNWIRAYNDVAKQKYVPTTLYPIRAYLNDAKTPEELIRRKKVLNSIAKASPEQTIDEVLKDVGGLDSDIRNLFTKYDLHPEYVPDIMYNHEKSVGNKLINEEIARAKLEAQPPKELVEAPIVTQNNTAIETLHEVAGTEEVAKTVDELTEGKGADALTPEDVEVLKEEFGEEAYSVYKLVSDAAVSNAKAKLTKTNALETIVGRKLSEMASELVKKYGNGKAWNGLEMYDAIQTALHGDSTSYAELVDEIMASGGRVGILSRKGIDPNVQAALTDFVNEVNKQLNTEILKLHTSANDFGKYIGVMLNYDNASKILKTDFRKLKFDDTKRIIFENPFELTDAMKKFKESAEYTDFENFATRMSEYTQDLHKYVGFNYKDGAHVKHVLRFNPEYSAVIKGLYADVDLDKVSELSKRMLNSDSFKHMYGTFGVVRPGRSLRGNVLRYNRGEYKTFNFNPERVLSSTLTEGVLSNSEVQSFVGLFVNDNFKVSQYFKDADELIDVLYAKNANGKISGNLDNLEVVAPVYDENGKVLRFKHFDKTSRAALDSAIKTKDAILVPSALVAHLDIWCKKDAKMSNRIYRFFNKYFSLPYKFGVLANPGFLLGNIGDAYLKQATTLSQKYGTNFAEEVANVATSLREVYHLNNVASESYAKIIDTLDRAGVYVPPFERPIEALNLNNNARQRIVDYLNGKLLNGAGAVVPLPEGFTNTDADALRVWMYINTFQTTKNLGEGFRDVSKEGMFKDVGSSVIERIFYGSKKFSFKNSDWKKAKNWGLFLNNPWINAIFDASGSLEAYFRSANVLNSLKHAGYDTHNLAKLLGEGYDAATSEKLHVDTINALNVMFNSNFNYDAQSELMHKLSYAVPFPTFFIKNFAYWMELLVENPEYIDTALTIQEGLWNDREDEVKEDRFMAEAKGRGAIPISDGDNKGLSKLFKGIYKPTPLNSMFGAFNLLNNPVEDLTNRVHPLINAPLQMLQAEMGQQGIGLATQEDATDVKYRPYSMNKFEKNIPYTSPDFDWREYLFHKLNPHDRAMSNAMRLPHKLGTGDVHLADILPSVFQPDF